jgi:arylsulfatase A-like enzyme
MARRVFLISIDDLRYDALSCETDTRYLDRYGLASLRRTPTLDGCAAGGVRFGQAIAAASYTPASHATMLTGRFPPSHGVRAFMTRGLDASVPTLAETFAMSGFHTVSAIDFGEMFALLGLDRGFDARFVADDRALLAHLREHASEPLFCFIHLVDVHPPVGESFCPPWDGYSDDFYAELEAVAADLGVGGPIASTDADERRREAVAMSGRVRMWAEDRRIADLVELPRYLAGVSKFDGGRLRWLLDQLDEAVTADDTLLVITSDHGQAPMASWRMGDPRVPLKFDHGETVVEEAIRVPLIISGPRIPAGGVVEQQVSLADVPPTVLDWAGIDPEDGVQGRSLLSLIDGEEVADSTAYAEVWFHSRSELSRYLRRSIAAGGLLGEGYNTFLNQRIVRTPRFKYSRRGSELTAADHAAADAEFVRACHERLLAQQADPVLAAEHARELREGTRTRAGLAEDLAGRNPDREALYDLRADPHEEVNQLVLARSLQRLGIAHHAPGIAAELAAAMDEIDPADAGPPAEAVPARVGAGTGDGLGRVEARLRDLGYIE